MYKVDAKVLIDTVKAIDYFLNEVNVEYEEDNVEIISVDTTALVKAIDKLEKVRKTILNNYDLKGFK
jgi:hypothetical protein